MNVGRHVARLNNLGFSFLLALVAPLSSHSFASQIEFSECLRPGGNGRTQEEGRRVLRRFARGQEGARVFQGTLGPLPRVLLREVSFRMPIARRIAAESRGTHLRESLGLFGASSFFLYS